MAKAKALTLVDMRSLLNWHEEEAKAEGIAGTHKAVKHYLDAALLAEKIIRRYKSEDEAQQEVRPSYFVEKAQEAIQQILTKDNGYIRKNQHAMFPLLMAMHQASPDVYGEYALWNILSNFTVAVLDDQQKAVQRATHLEFFRDRIEPFLFRQIFEARDEGNLSRMGFLIEDLWQPCVLVIYELARSEGGRLVRDRIRGLEKASGKNAARIDLLQSMLPMFKRRDEEITAMKASRTLQSGDEAAMEVVRRIAHAKPTHATPSLPRPAIDAPALDEETSAEEVSGEAGPRRPMHLTAGTTDGGRLKHPQLMADMLKKYTPEGPAN